MLLGSCGVSLCACCANSVLDFHPLSSSYMERLEESMLPQLLWDLHESLCAKEAEGWLSVMCSPWPLVFGYVENGLRL